MFTEGDSRPVQALSQPLFPDHHVCHEYRLALVTCTREPTPPCLSWGVSVCSCLLRTHLQPKSTSTACHTYIFSLLICATCPCCLKAPLVNIDFAMVIATTTMISHFPGCLAWLSWLTSRRTLTDTILQIRKQVQHV